MEEVVHTSPTLGSNVEEVVWKNIHFVMWDLGGQDSLRQGWQAYYANTEVLIILFLSILSKRH
jgi:GTPase SAR1 family protein